MQIALPREESDAVLQNEYLQGRSEVIPTSANCVICLGLSIVHSVLNFIPKCTYLSMSCGGNSVPTGQALGPFLKAILEVLHSDFRSYNLYNA